MRARKIVGLLLGTAAVTAVVISQIPGLNVTSAGPIQSQHADVQAELVQAGYHRTTVTHVNGGNANRTVTDQRWERSQAPEVIILSDDTVAGAGVFVINAITYSGADGNGVHHILLTDNIEHEGLPSRHVHGDGEAAQSARNE